MKTLIIGLLLFVSVISQVSADSYTERLRLLNDPETKTYIKYMDELTSYMRNKVSNFSEVKKELFYFRIGGKLQDLKAELITQMKNEKVDTRNIQIYSDVLDYMILYCFEKSGDNYVEETDTYLYDILMKKVEETEVPNAYEECIEGKQLNYNGKTYNTKCFDYLTTKDSKIETNKEDVIVIGFTYEGLPNKEIILDLFGHGMEGNQTRKINIGHTDLVISKDPEIKDPLKGCKAIIDNYQNPINTPNIIIGDNYCNLEKGEKYYISIIPDYDKILENYKEETFSYYLSIPNGEIEPCKSGTDIQEYKLVCMGDRKWGQGKRQYTMNGNEVHAFKIQYNGGNVKFSWSDGGGKAISISPTPGDAEGWSWDFFNAQYCTNTGLEGSVFISSKFCKLEVGKTYYINIRNPMRQFNVYWLSTS